MIISVISYKGGVGKSTSVLHIAACLARQSPTIAIDGDQNASLLDWEGRGEGLPFKVVHKEAAAKYAGQFDHVVIDTAARPEPRHLRAIAETADRLILATSVDGVSMAALKPAIDDLKSLKADYQVLLTLCPPVGNAAIYARKGLEAQGVPVLKSEIRRYAAFQKAGMNGTLVWDVSDENALIGGRDYEELTEEILAK